MKLTMSEVEARLTAAWGREVAVLPYRICGNRLTYLVTDHKAHWLLLLRTWEGGRVVFEPLGGRGQEGASEETGGLGGVRQRPRERGVRVPFAQCGSLSSTAGAMLHKGPQV
jgi:hypothetical protein